MSSMKHKYEVVIAPGCHGKVFAPVVSRHRSLAAAVRQAMKSDRVEVQPTDSHVTLFRAQSKQPTRWGYGCYGGRHQGAFREALKEAQAAESAYRAR